MHSSLPSHVTTSYRHGKMNVTHRSCLCGCLPQLCSECLCLLFTVGRGFTSLCSKLTGDREELLAKFQSTLGWQLTGKGNSERQKVHSNTPDAHCVYTRKCHTIPSPPRSSREPINVRETCRESRDVCTEKSNHTRCLDQYQ